MLIQQKKTEFVFKWVDNHLQKTAPVFKGTLA